MLFIVPLAVLAAVVLIGLNAARRLSGPGSHAPPPVASAADAAGARVYRTSCAMCHASGGAGAPRPGDQPAWAKRLQAAGSLDALVDHAIHGTGSMPARGGSGASDAQIRAAVVYMSGAAQR